MTFRSKIFAGFVAFAGLTIGVLAYNPFGIVQLAQAATLRMQVRHAIVGTYTGSNDLGSPTFQLQPGNQADLLLANGTGSGQANVLFTDQRSLGASGTEGLDLFGSLTDPFGTTLNFATVKLIKICAAAGNTNNVNYGPGLGLTGSAFVGPFGANTYYSSVKPGGCALLVAPQTGWTVTATTGDILPIGNSGGTTSVTYDIYVIGTQ